MRRSLPHWPPEGWPGSVHGRTVNAGLGAHRRAIDDPPAPDRLTLSAMPAACSDSSADATLLVCVTCKSEEGQVGASLYAALGERLSESGVALRPVECFAVCKRPCTVALSAPGKWTYVVGDLRPEEHVEDIVAAAQRYAAAADGLVPWRERPLPFRKGIISRTPPFAHSPSA